MTLELMPFAETLARTNTSRRHLLLGNGFSISARRSFRYPALFDTVPTTAAVHAVLRRADGDFEAAMRLLDEDIESATSDAERATLRAEKEQLKDLLIHALTEVHPGSARELTADELNHCSRFLGHFIGMARGRLRGNIFTTNYDLLLYWTLVARREGLRCQDGFREEGRWYERAQSSTGDPHPSTVYYLHGALHLYDRGGAVTKMLYEWGQPLMAQIRARLDRGDYPVFVSEGTAAEKARTINSRMYSRNALRRFRSACRLRGDVLFAVGQSFGEHDQHIVEAIGRGRIEAVFLGVYRGPGSTDIARSEVLAAEWRKLADAAGRSFQVGLFDVAECNIWRDG